MTKQEFEQRVKMEVNENYFHAVIEQQYYASLHEKDAFCENWKRDHKGMTEKLLAMVALDTLPLIDEIRSQDNRHLADMDILKKVCHERDELRAQVEAMKIEVDALRNCQAENDSLVKRLYTMAQEGRNAELRDEVVSVWGWHNYLLYKLRHDDGIWEDEKKQLIDLLD